MTSKIMLVIAISCLWISAAFSRARFMGIEELVAVSDVIAVIEVTRAERIGDKFSMDLPKKGSWRYSQKNTFRFVNMVKNEDFVVFEQEKEQVLWAEKSFVCAMASYVPGNYLVFLESVGTNEWITLNHHRGGLSIDDDDNVLKFGWYLDSKDYKKKVSLNEAKTTIQNVILDAKSVSFEANIPPGLRYNKWISDALSQKLWFHVHKSPKQNWPDRLAYFVRAFLKNKSLTKQEYQSIAEQGGRYNIKASWDKGYLVIDSIEAVQD